MSESKTEKLPTIVSPKGVAKYPKLSTPDTKYNPDGVYSIKLEVDETTPGAVEFKERVLKAEADAIAAAEKALKKGKKLKVADSAVRCVLDDEGNEVPGKFEITAKMKASGVSKKTGKPWSMRPGLFDAKGHVFKGKVGGGSVVKVALQLKPFDSPTLGAGVSIRLEAVQVFELKDFTEKSAGAYGFGTDEEGYDASMDEGDESAESGDTASDEDGGEDETPTQPRQRGDF